MMRVEQYWSHSFIPGLIGEAGVVFDIGVNSGGFACIVAPCCARVIGFEPDPMWRNKLNLPANVELLQLAVAARAGVLQFHVNREKCSSLHYADADSDLVEVESITLEQALARTPIEHVDLIKMDIEGEELAVLSTVSKETLARVMQLTVEFHDFLDPASLPQIKSVVARLEGFGFIAFRFSWRSHGDYLFINRELVKMGASQRLWIIFRYKYIRGILRIIRRKLNMDD